MQPGAAALHRRNILHSAATVRPRCLLHQLRPPPNTRLCTDPAPGGPSPAGGARGPAGGPGDAPHQRSGRHAAARPRGPLQGGPGGGAAGSARWQDPVAGAAAAAWPALRHAHGSCAHDAADGFQGHSQGEECCCCNCCCQHQLLLGHGSLMLLLPAVVVLSLCCPCDGTVLQACNIVLTVKCKSTCMRS